MPSCQGRTWPVGGCAGFCAGTSPVATRPQHAPSPETPRFPGAFDPDCASFCAALVPVLCRLGRLVRDVRGGDKSLFSGRFRLAALEGFEPVCVDFEPVYSHHSIQPALPTRLHAPRGRRRHQGRIGYVKLKSSPITLTAVTGVGCSWCCQTGAPPWRGGIPPLTRDEAQRCDNGLSIETHAAAAEGCGLGSQEPRASPS